MPPTFQERGFVFEENEQVPEHVEGWPQLGEQGENKWWLRGTDTFSYEDYVLAINIDDAETASFLARARLRELERTQPTSSSGGQGFGGIQDRVDVMPPGSRLELRE